MIQIYGPITTEDYGIGYAYADRIAADIRSTSGPLNIAVNTPGGEVAGLTQIVAAINTWRRANPKAPLKVRIDGLAASCGALLLLELPRPASIAAVRGSMIMVHGASLEFISGGAGAMRDAAAYLERIDRRILDDLERFGFAPEEIAEWTAEGRQHWFTAEEALEHGIITAIIGGDVKPLEEALDAPEGLKAVALFYPQAPPTPTNEDNPMPEEDIKKVVTEEVTEEVIETAAEPTPEELLEKIASLESELEAKNAELEEQKTAAAKLQQELDAKSDECNKAVAKLSTLTGGMRAAVAPKPTARTFKSALAEYRASHPRATYDDAFAAVAKAEPALYASIRK